MDFSEFQLFQLFLIYNTCFVQYQKKEGKIPSELEVKSTQSIILSISMYVCVHQSRLELSGRLSN